MNIIKKRGFWLARENQGLVVDVLNNPVGIMDRALINSEKRFYRQTAVIVTCEEKIYVQQRAFHKDCHPGYWEIIMGGHIQKDETDETAALRELNEELGVSGIPINHICTMSVGNDGWFSWVVFYHGLWNGSVRFNSEETSQVQLLTLCDIEQMIREDHLFTPLSLRFLEINGNFLKNVVLPNSNM